MATIKFTDEFGTDVSAVNAIPKPGISAFAKYCRNPQAGVVLLSSVTAILQQPLAAVKQMSATLGLKFSSEVDFGTAQPELKIGANEVQTVTIQAQPGKSLTAADLFGPQLEVAAGEGYVSLALSGKLNGGLSQKVGNLCFGFTTGTGVEFEYFRRFAVDSASPTVAQALGETISNFIIPADVSDFDGLQTGDIAAVSGSGSLKLSGDVTVPALGNPLASPKLPLADQAVELQAGGEIDIGASFELTGSWQIRVRKTADTSVELAWYRKKGEQWSVSAQASEGVGIVFGKTDLLEKLIGAVSKDPHADIDRLKAAGLNDSEIDKVQDQIEKSVEHSLKASLEMELAASDSDEAAFLYRVDTANLDAVSLRAIHAALDGDLSQLTELEKNDDGHGAIASGVTMLRSCFRSIRDRKPSLKINLLGLLNFSTISELLQKSEVLYEPVTGDLTVTETVSGTRIEALTLPQAKDKLRKVQFDSLLVTTAYRASSTLGSMNVASSCVHFAFNDNTNSATIADYLNGAVGLGLLDEPGKERIVADFTGGGPSTCEYRVAFDDAACEAMFLKNGSPRQQTEYETIARAAWQALIGDEGGYRIDVLRDNAVWAKLKAAGQPGFGSVLPGLAADPARLETVRADYTIIMWWAESMASTAIKLAEMKTFVGAADPATLRNDNTFVSQRSDLQKHLADVVAKSGLKFNQPFGLVALYRAALPNANASGIVASNTLTRGFAPGVAAA